MSKMHFIDPPFGGSFLANQSLQNIVGKLSETPLAAGLENKKEVQK